MAVEPEFKTFNRGVELRNARKLPEAIAAFRQAAAEHPDHANTFFHLGLSLDELGSKEEAVEAYRKVILLEPRMAAAHSNLGGTLNTLQRYDEAIASCRRAIDLQPDIYQAHYNLANVLHYTGRIEEAAASFRRVVQLSPADVNAASNYLFTLHFDPRWDAHSLLHQHKVWDRYYAEPLRDRILPHENDRTPERRLRVGYVSQNLCAHVLGINLLPLLSRHDHKQFEVFCYSSESRADAMTDELRKHAGVWRDISAMNDDQAAAQIRADRIDILVDLSLHSTQHRLLVFARKPAPVQVTYLGYCSTTGMSAMDWRLSDPHLDPPETEPSCYSEKTMRLSSSYWCYQPRKSPPIAPAPGLRNGFITFGCLNTFSKASPPAVELWARILDAVPRSRLILHCPFGSHREELLARFSARGVSAQRIELIARQNWSDYIQTYQRIDVALDPFPYGGGITTFDALWMGVPVVTLSGRTAVGRGGRSILSYIGMPELIARSPEEYLRIAVIAEQWIAYRPTLRGRMQESAVMDAGGLARNVEAAYRRMWREWIGKEKVEEHVKR